MRALASAVNIIRIEAMPTSTPMRWRSALKRRGSSPPPPGPPPPGPPPPGPRPFPPRPRPPRRRAPTTSMTASVRVTAVSFSPVSVVAITSPSLYFHVVGVGDVRPRLVRRRLQHVVLGRARHPELVGAAVDDGHAAAEVVVRRRRRRDPLQRRRLPGVVRSLLALEEAPEEVEDEEELHRDRDDGRPRHEVDERLGRLVEVINPLQ